MKTKTDIQQGTNTLKINAIREEITQRGRKVVEDKLKVIEEERLKGELGTFFKDVYTIYKELDSKSDQQLVKAIWQNQEDHSTKAKQLAEFLASKEKTDLLVYGERFLKLFKTDKELHRFLANPQAYIDTHKNWPAYKLQILQWVINSTDFNSLPSVNRKIPSGSGDICTPLANYMHQLNLPNYTSTDARRFPQCIETKAETQVLEKADKPYYGSQFVGMGVQSRYKPETIQQTANIVKKTQRGACHDFAQRRISFVWHCATFWRSFAVLRMTEACEKLSFIHTRPKLWNIKLE